MSILRVAINSLALVVADLAGIGIGAVVAYRVSGVPNQVWLQLPVAVLATLVLFCGWVLAARLFIGRHVQPPGHTELVFWLFMSLIWAPIVFLPLHYLTQGYLTSVGNFVALALYQVPVNSLALVASAGLANRVCHKTP